MTEDRQYSFEVPNTARNDRGPIFRGSPTATPELAFEGCYTLYEMLRRGRDVNPLGPCLGFRAVSTSGYATPFVYSCYTECVARVDTLAAGLDTMALCPRTDDGLILVSFDRLFFLLVVVVSVCTFVVCEPFAEKTR